MRATSGRVAGAVVASGEVEDGFAARRVPSVVPGDEGGGVRRGAPDPALAPGAASAEPDIRVGVGRTETRRDVRRAGARGATNHHRGAFKFHDDDANGRGA